jgi:hypothetical protein
MTLYDCVPGGKHDLGALERAATVGFPALNDVIPDLLRWLQDANWPVAQPTAALLANAGRDIVPHIRTILNGDDAIWKYWTLELLVTRMNLDLVRELKEEFEQLANHPGKSDQLEDVDRVARHILATHLP